METRNNKNSRTFIALIRAINVGGHAVIKMSDLIKMFEQLGFKDVSTYIQKGNVIFSTSQADKSKLAGNTGFEYCKPFK